MSLFLTNEQIAKQEETKNNLKNKIAETLKGSSTNNPFQNLNLDTLGINKDGGFSVRDRNGSLINFNDENHILEKIKLAETNPYMANKYRKSLAFQKKEPLPEETENEQEKEAALKLFRGEFKPLEDNYNKEVYDPQVKAKSTNHKGNQDSRTWKSKIGYKPSDKELEEQNKDFISPDDIEYFKLINKLK